MARGGVSVVHDVDGCENVQVNVLVGDVAVGAELQFAGGEDAVAQGLQQKEVGLHSRIKYVLK